MQVSQQMSQHLSLSPSNVVYQAIMLLALLVTAAIAYTQWRRDGRDALSRRLVWGAAAIFLLRASLLMTAVLLTTLVNQATATAILPPLEWAIDGVTTVLLIWILAPPFEEWSQAAASVFLIALIFPGVLYAFFAPEWLSQMETGIAYAATWQARAWSIFQLLVLGAGMALIIGRRPSHFGIRLAVPIILFVAQIAAPLAALLFSAVGAPHPITFGYLAAFPLLAVLAYQHTVSQLVHRQPAERPATGHLLPSLPYSQEIITSIERYPALHHALRMVGSVLPVDFVAVMVPPEDGSGYLHLTGLRPGREREAREWGLNLADWPAFRLALELSRPIELVPHGIGARQLYELYGELGLEVTGPLLVEPLTMRGQSVGLLLLGGRRADQSWSAEDREMIALLADRVAQTVEPARRFRPEPAARPAEAARAAEEAHRAELAALQEQIETLQARLLAEQQEKQGLAAALAARQEEVADRVIADLEAEVTTLRQSLRQTEEELDRMATSDSRIDVEWVSRTVSGYSAALSQAEMRVAELEDRLGLIGGPESSPVVVSLVEELRALITSVADRGQMLLSRKSPALSDEGQRLIRWMRADIHRVRLLLEQLLHLLLPDSHLLADEPEGVDLRQVIRQAIADNSVLREQSVEVEVAVASDMPLLTARQRTVYHIVSQLLRLASLSVPAGGHIFIAARPQEEDEDEPLDGLDTFTLTIAQLDTGLPVEAPSGRGRGERREANSFRQETVDLSLARTLVLAIGGRLWIEHEAGRGNLLTAVLPLSPPGGPSSPPERDDA